MRVLYIHGRKENSVLCLKNKIVVIPFALLSVFYKCYFICQMVQNAILKEKISLSRVFLDFFDVKIQLKFKKN